jgi:hypothetical protein
LVRKERSDSTNACALFCLVKFVEDERTESARRAELRPKPTQWDMQERFEAGSVGDCYRYVKPNELAELAK